MAKQVVPVSTTSEIPETKYDPLMNEAPAQKEYQKANLDTTGIPEFIPEANYEKPTIDFSKPIENDDIEQISASKSEDKATFNPATNDLSKKDKRHGAEMMADTIIGGYEYLIENLLIPIAKIKPQKIEEKIMSKEISPNLKFAVDTEGNVANVREYVSSYNETVSDALKVSDEFKENVREPIIRVALEHGLALTDIQYIGLEFGKELIGKSVVVMQLKKSTNLIITMLEAETAKSISVVKTQPTVTTKPEPTIENPTSKAYPEPKIVKEEVSISNEEQKLTFDNLHQKVVETSKPEIPKENLGGFGNSDLLAHMESQSEETSKSIPSRKSNAKKETKNTKKESKKT